MKTGRGSGSSGKVSAPTRRTVLGALLAMPAVAALARRASPRHGATASRPGSIGGSGACCAVCGSGAHSMLACPDSPKVV